MKLQEKKHNFSFDWFRRSARTKVSPSIRWHFSTFHDIQGNNHLHLVPNDRCWKLWPTEKATSKCYCMLVNYYFRSRWLSLLDVVFFPCSCNSRPNRHVKPRVLCLNVSPIVHITVSLSCSHTFTRMQIHLTCNWRRRRLLPVLHISTANRTAYRHFSTQLGPNARKFCYIWLRACLHANTAASRENRLFPSAQRSSYRKAAKVWLAWMAKWTNERVLAAMISKQTGDALNYCYKIISRIA